MSVRRQRKTSLRTFLVCEAKDTNYMTQFAQTRTGCHCVNVPSQHLAIFAPPNDLHIISSNEIYGRCRCVTYMSFGLLFHDRCGQMRRTCVSVLTSISLPRPQRCVHCTALHCDPILVVLWFASLHSSYTFVAAIAHFYHLISFSSSDIP